MAYIFKKLNNLTGSAGQSNTGEVIGSSGSGGTTQKDPYASTYQNPNKIYQANLGENMGQLNTGTDKSITNTQNELTKSSDAYNTGLNTVDSKYAYNGRQDLENIGDANTFSRLGGLINPETGKAELGGVQSKSQYLNADASGTAAASTVGGLTQQLKDQYGTSTGGARLDAQLYRGSGQAGAAINKDIGQLKDFQVDKTQRLGAEKANLDSKGQAISDRSAALKTDGTGYQGELLGTAKSQAAADQASYNTNRDRNLNEVNKHLVDETKAGEIRKAIQEGFGGRAAIKDFGTSDLAAISRALTDSGVTEYGWANRLASEQRDNGKVDMTEYLQQKILGDNLSQASLGNLRADQFVTGPKTFSESSYIDPRYNQLASLLGGNQIIQTEKQTTDSSIDRDRLQSSILAQLNPQLTSARNQASAFFDPAAASGGSGGGGGSFDMIQKLLGASANPVGAGIGSLFGGW